MAYKTKAEKKAFRAGMRYQKKCGTVWEVTVRRDGRSRDMLFAAPSKAKAEAAYRAHAKKYPDTFARTTIEGIRKHPINYD